jgi:hypothetical protein
MSGLDPNARIWFSVIIALIVVGATMQSRPINIAASDNPPSISTPVDSFNEGNRMSVEERRADLGSRTPDVYAAPQIFYRGGNVSP